MINLLENYTSSHPNGSLSLEEDELISIIYRFASKKEEWFNLLLSLSNCISISEELPADHPYKDMAHRVMTHLKTAIKISAQLNTSEKPLHAESALNHIPMAAVIINEAGRIIEINKSAENYFKDSDAWNMDQGYLSATHLRLNAELVPLYDDQHFSVLTLPLEPTGKQEDKVSFIKGNKPQAKLMHLTALPQNETETELSKHFYLCFKSQQESIIDAESLKAHFHLTDTEALVVITLMSEISSKKTANKLKLKDATVRGHLTSIYQKFGVTRKADLIRSVLLYKLAKPQASTPSRQICSKADSSTNHSHEYIYLKDGRKLSYVEYPKSSYLRNKRATDFNCKKEAERQTIVILHNLMGSAKELPPGSESLFEQENIRIIVPDRPGYGDSDPHPNRTHQNWVKDIEQLLDSLKIDTVKIIAHSIGGVYALAMAEMIPNRVERIAMVNAMTRIEDIMSCDNIPLLVSALNRSLKFAPFLLEPILKMAVGKDIEHFYSQQLNYIRPTLEGRAADINLLKRNDYRNYAIANLKHSAKQGVGIWAEELKISFAELDFSVTNTKTEYQFWHGDHDDVVPLQAAENLAKDLNTSNFNRLTSETHFLFARHFNDVVTTLIS